MDVVQRRRARRRYQQRVNALLEAIDNRHRQQLALAARGVTPMGMRELEADLHKLRNELAAVIAASSSAPTTPEAARDPLASTGHEATIQPRTLQPQLQHAAA